MLAVASLRTNSGCTWVVCERVVAALRTRSGRDSRDPVSWSHCRDGKPSSWYESASESLIAQCLTGMRFQLCKDHKWPLGPALPCPVPGSTAGRSLCTTPLSSFQLSCWPVGSSSSDFVLLEVWRVKQAASCQNF